MSTQIAVRRPEDIVEFVAGLVRDGNAASRAIVVIRAPETRGLDTDGVISCDNIVTVPANVLATGLKPC